MPMSPGICCPCGGVRRQGVCDRCGPARRSTAWKSDTRYTSRRWRAIAKAQLQMFPLCAECERGGHVAPATVCDHVEPHRGEDEAFWNNERQSLCASCHGRKSNSERKVAQSAITTYGKARGGNVICSSASSVSRWRSPACARTDPVQQKNVNRKIIKTNDRKSSPNHD